MHRFLIFPPTDSTVKAMPHFNACRDIAKYERPLSPAETDRSNRRNAVSNPGALASAQASEQASAHASELVSALTSAPASALATAQESAQMSSQALAWASAQASAQASGQSALASAHASAQVSAAPPRSLDRNGWMLELAKHSGVR